MGFNEWGYIIVGWGIVGVENPGRIVWLNVCDKKLWGMRIVGLNNCGVE